MSLFFQNLMNQHTRVVTGMLCVRVCVRDGWMEVEGCKRRAGSFSAHRRADQSTVRKAVLLN